MKNKHPLADCGSCPYREQGYVPTRGPMQSDLVFIGAAPGKTEVRKGVPFTGISGDVLNHLLGQNGIDRSEATLTNVVACRPPDNEEPNPKAIKACKRRFEAEVAARKPETIVAMGNTAATAVLGYKTKITKDRVGPPRRTDFATLEGVRVVPTLHPAAILRSADMYPFIDTDFRKINGQDTLYSNVKHDVITDMDEAVRFLRMVSEHYAGRRVAFDIESGADKDEDYSHGTTVLCVSITAHPGYAVVIDGPAIPIIELEQAIRATDNVFHSGKYDLGVLGIPNALKNDTLIKSYILDERPRTNGLKYNGQELLGAPKWDEGNKKYTKGGKGFENIPKPQLWEYCGWDTSITHDLDGFFDKHLTPKQQELHDWLVTASNMLQDVEQRGLKVDTIRLSELGEQYKGEIAELREELSEWVDNPNSPKQIQRTLFIGWNIDTPTTDAAFLTELQEKAPDSELKVFVTLLLAHRKVAKSYGTYVKGIEKRLTPYNTVHPTFLIHGSTTGRLSCRNPNVQNVTRGKNLRSIYIPHRAGNVLLQGDYKNNEGRVVAVLAGAEQVIRSFAEGRDVHSETATAIYGPEFDYEQRVNAKTISHGLNYGRKAHGISDGLGISLTEAQKAVARYWEFAPEILEWQKEIHRIVFETDEYLETPTGRIRRIPFITDENYDDIANESLAFKPQSIGSDICLEGAIRCNEAGLYVVNVVHDSVLVECHPSEIRETALKMKECMEPAAWDIFPQARNANVPFEVEFEVGTDWGNLEDYVL